MIARPTIPLQGLTVGVPVEVDEKDPYIKRLLKAGYLVRVKNARAEGS